MSVCKRAAAPVFLLATALVMTSALFSCGGEGKKDGRRADVTGEEVKKEIGEALDVTRDYLRSKKEDVRETIEDRLKSMDSEIDTLLDRADAAGKKGRKEAEKALEALNVKKEEARRKLREFEKSGGKLKGDAREKMERAIGDLEEAFRNARESLTRQEE